MFCGKNEHDSKKIKKIFENCVEELGLKVFTWRDVPIAPNKIGKTAREIMPILQQVFVGSEVKTSSMISSKNYLSYVKNLKILS